MEIKKYNDNGYASYSYYSNIPLNDKELKEKLKFSL